MDQSLIQVENHRSLWRIQRREARRIVVVEHESSADSVFGFWLFWGFLENLVALVVAVRGAKAGQLREKLDEAAMAREDRLVDGCDDG